MVKYFQKFLKKMGVGLVRYSTLERLHMVDEDVERLLKLMLRSNQDDLNSYAQLCQDVIVLLATGFKREGFFVEFGATDGVYLSNTYLLEKDFGWKGILSEPARVWHPDLVKNRKVEIDFACVWSENSIVTFDMVDSAELSSVSGASMKDMHKEDRRAVSSYEVEAITLDRLLERHNAPKSIDYLSIDTEGSEYEILKQFDFNKYNVSIITVEHNFTKNRERLFELLSSKGYLRKFESISKWDDWYFKRGVIDI